MNIQTMEPPQGANAPSGGQGSPLAFALHYAQLGYRVFPCLPGEKRPACPHGLNDATTNEAQIEDWWEKNPNYNLALNCEDLIVIDVDPDGLEWYDETKRESIEALNPPKQKTPRGGCHIFFRRPEGVNWRPTTGKLAKGVDTRTNGSYIVVAPSLTENGFYKWENNLVALDEIPSLPDWLQEELNQLHELPRRAAPEGENGSVIPEGQRNDALTREGGKLRRTGLEEPEINAALQAINKLRCNPPLPEKEVAGIAHSVAQYPKGNFREPTGPPTEKLGKYCMTYTPTPGKKKGVFLMNAPDGTPAVLEEVNLINSGDRKKTESKIKEHYQEEKEGEIDQTLKKLAAESIINSERGKNHKKNNGGNLQGQEVRIDYPEPWPQPVELADVLSEAADLIGGAVVCSEEQKIACTLWAAWTWIVDKFDIAPILSITSPVARCGKSTLAEVVATMVCRPLKTSNITPAALFRVIELAKPTLLIDEGDTFLKMSEELRGILNSGHSRKAAFVIRTVGDDFEVRQFSTWGAKVIALIGSLPGTLHDRSIEIRLSRKNPKEKTLTMDAAKKRGEEIARKFFTWSQGLPKELPPPPEVEFLNNDRAIDNWRPLLAIADLAGGDWPTKARRAAITLESRSEAEEYRERFLPDCLAAFGENEMLLARDIADRLAALEEAPWATWNHGKSIYPSQVGKLLREFGIEPQKSNKGRLYFREKVEAIAKKFSYCPENAFTPFTPFTDCHNPLENKDLRSEGPGEGSEGPGEG